MHRRAQRASTTGDSPVDEWKPIWFIACCGAEESDLTDAPPPDDPKFVSDSQR